MSDSVLDPLRFLGLLLYSEIPPDLLNQHKKAAMSTTNKVAPTPIPPVTDAGKPLPWVIGREDTVVRWLETVLEPGFCSPGSTGVLVMEEAELDWKGWRLVSVDAVTLVMTLVTVGGLVTGPEEIELRQELSEPD